MRCGVFGLLVLPCLLAPLLLLSAKYFLGWRPVVLEPEGLSEHWAAYGRARLTEEQSETFRRDGVVVLRGGPADRALLGKLEPSLRVHQQFHEAEFNLPWLYNGAVRSILRAGHVADVMLQLLQCPSVMDEAPIWGKDADPQGRMQQGAWHMDGALREPSGWTMITAWLAITDAPHGIEFLRGSWRPAVNEGLYRACNRSAELGQRGERILGKDCIGRYAKEAIDPQLGYSSRVWWDLKAGDMVLFRGTTVHRGVAWARKRLALSVRMRPMPAEHLGAWMCNAERVAFYPLGSAERQEGADPFECTRQMVVAEPGSWREMPRFFRLPPEKELNQGLRLLRAAVAWVQGVFLSV